MRDIRTRVTDHRHHPPQDGSVRAEEINERDAEYEYQSADETTCHEHDLRRTDQFFIMIELIRPEKIEQQEQQRNDRVIDAVFQKRIGSGGKEPEVFTEKDERGDVPAHDEHAQRDPDNGITEGIDITQILRCQIQRIRAESFHESAVHRREKDTPKDQYHLVFPEMQE